MSDEVSDEKYDTGGAADYLKHYAPGTLANWRHDGGGPRFCKPKPGGRVFYLRSDLDAWLKAARFESTAEYQRRDR